MNKKIINMLVNETAWAGEVKADKTLLHFIREDLGLTGTKCGCEIGECGACTVLLDGRPVQSCLVLAAEADGKKLETIEGVGSPEKLDPIQEAFLDLFAVQCGFCTPGMIMAAKALLNDNNDPSEDEILDALKGHLCRCTGYDSIIKAVRRAAETCSVG